MFDSASSAVITSATGKVKILAVAANARVAALPDVPTFAEQGYAGLDLPSWLGFYGPARMPAPVLEKLNTALTKVLAMPQVREFYRSGGYEAGATTPEEFASITRATYEQWGAMVQQVGLAKQ
jgi:tripartite-type tricarboxylate transporter receptor subunit TctC